LPHFLIFSVAKCKGFYVIPRHAGCFSRFPSNRLDKTLSRNRQLLFAAKIRRPLLEKQLKPHKRAFRVLKPV